jgi:type IV pilus assembly protein PilC
MTIYICKLGTSDGKVISREFEAADPVELRRHLEEEGYFVFDVRRRRLRLLSGIRIRRRGVKTRSLLLFNQELLVLIKAGMPMLQILDTILERQDAGPLSIALRQLREDVKGGDALSTALERHTQVFPSLYIASIRSGERTGELSVTIQRYIQYLKKIEGIRKKLVSSLFYPCILVVVSFLAIGLLLFYVIPVFSQIFADAGSQLPFLTQVLISFTSTLRSFAPLLLLLTVACVVVYRSWVSGDKGRYAVDRFKLKIPYIGNVLKGYSLASFSRTLANLLGSGIPIIISLRMSIGTLNNVYMEKRLFEAAREIEEGRRLSSAFERTGIMPPLAVRMLAVGESTGALEEMLANIAEYLGEALDEQLHFITAAIEPAIMIVMGLIIGTIIIAMYLPIFQLAGAVG